MLGWWRSRFFENEEGHVIYFPGMSGMRLQRLGLRGTLLLRYNCARQVSKETLPETIDNPGLPKASVDTAKESRGGSKHL